MVTIETPREVVKVNQSRARRNYDEWHDAPLPPNLEPPSASVEPKTAEEDEEDTGVPGVPKTPDTPVVSTKAPVDSVTLARDQSAPVPALWMTKETGLVNFLAIGGNCEVLSQVVAEDGGSVAQPIFYNTGFDLTTSQGREQAWKVVEEQDPLVLWITPEEGYESNYSYARFCVQLAKYQMRKGYHFLVGSSCPAIWKTKNFRDLGAKEGVLTGTSDLCCFGQVDQSDMPVRHPFTVMHNFPNGVLNPLFRKCNHGKSQHTTGPVAHLPRKFCQDFSCCTKSLDTGSRKTSYPLHSLSEALIWSLFEGEEDADSLRDLASWLTKRSEGIMYGHCPSVMSASAEVGLTKPLKVREDWLKELMAWINALPKGTELLMNTTEHPWRRKMDPLLRKLRSKYLPRHNYLHCSVLRGTRGIPVSYTHLTLPTKRIV